MDHLRQLVDLFLHVDDHLVKLADAYGPWVYAILFLIVFCETGLVVTPFLPGDSLLFAAGALAGGGSLNVFVLMILLTVAAVLGDAVNYTCGAWIGPRVFREKRRFLKKEYLDKTQRFYEKHGRKTIILARFVPIVRTFAPFVAGVGKMPYRQFFCYNVVGGVIWVCGLVGLGYWFGGHEFVKKHFELVVVAIVLISVLPIGIEWVKARREEAKGQRGKGAKGAETSETTL